MTNAQSSLHKFFGKKDSRAPKRTSSDLAQHGAAATDGPAEAAASASEPALKRPKEESAAVPSGAALALCAGVKGVPEVLLGHPVLQPLREMDDGWRKVVCTEAARPYFSRLIDFLAQEARSKQTIFPPAPLVLNALRLCSWEGVRVVILGQDPYHGPNQAHGLAFSVLPPTPPPPSLMNMYKEAVSDVGIDMPKHGNLEKWCRQGVLLLNTVLTVRRGAAHSHKGKGWENFTDAVIRELNDRKSGLVFLLWGKPAQEKGKSINKSKHRVITSNHPSPLSANKPPVPFMGSKCFSRANEALKELGKQPIDWSL